MHLCIQFICRITAVTPSTLESLCQSLCGCDSASAVCFRSVCCFQGLSGCFSSRGLSARAEVQHTVYQRLVYTSHSFQINITDIETEAGKQSEAVNTCRKKFVFLLMIINNHRLRKKYQRNMFFMFTLWKDFKKSYDNMKNMVLKKPQLLNYLNLLYKLHKKHTCIDTSFVQHCLHMCWL